MVTDQAGMPVRIGNSTRRLCPCCLKARKPRPYLVEYVARGDCDPPYFAGLCPYCWRTLAKAVRAKYRRIS